MEVIDYKGGAENAGGKYPVTVQGLDFIQQQILFLQQLGYVGGDCYIIKNPTSNSSGIIYIKGTLMLLLNNRTSESTHISFGEQCRDIEVGDELYADVACETYASWVTLSNPMEEAENLVRRDKVKEFKTNVELTELVKSLQLSVGKSMPVEKGRYTLSALATKITPMRIMCEEGSEVVDGHKEYSVDVYVGTNNVVRQILTTKDGSRYIRHLVDDNTRNFTKIDKPTIELRVVDGHLQMRKNFWVDESGQDGTGDVAEVGATDLSIILLRKKRRSRNAGRNRVNGTRRVRPKRQGWAHAWSAKINNANGTNVWTDVLIESCKLPPSGMGGVIIADAPPSASFERNSKVYDFLSKILIPKLLPRQGIKLKGGKTKKKGGVFAKFAIAVVRGDYRKVCIEDLAEFKFWFYRHPDHSLLTAITV